MTIETPARQQPEQITPPECNQPEVPSFETCADQTLAIPARLTAGGLYRATTVKDTPEGKVRTCKQCPAEIDIDPKSRVAGLYGIAHCAVRAYFLMLDEIDPDAAKSFYESTPRHRRKAGKPLPKSQ